MRYQVEVYDEDKDADEEYPGHAWEFDTEAEALAFYEGVTWVNDSALRVEKPEPIPEPEVTAHCDTCGIETTATDLPRPGSPCLATIGPEDEPRTCPGTYVEGPLPIFTLTRLEKVDVTYDVKALTLDDAFEALRIWDERSFVARFEDAGAYFETSEIRYLGTDDDWHYEPSDYDADDHEPPKLGGDTPETRRKAAS